MNQYLPLQMGVSKQKPNTMLNQEIPCPFCNRSQLKVDNKTLADNGEQLWIENKFPTLQNAYQTVFVEHDTCTYDLSSYPKETLQNVVTFAIEKWLEMKMNPSFASVVLLKNHGAYAGGTIFHPHMQIVGLEEIDYRTRLQPEWMEGLPIEELDGLTWNISTKPRTEFYEINVILTRKQWEERKETSDIFVRFCEMIQTTAHYITECLNPIMKSYNLVFYELEGQLIAKFISRGFQKGTVTSSYYLGFQISQVPSDIPLRVDELRTYEIDK